MLPRLLDIARADGRMPFVLCHYPFEAPPDGGLRDDHALDNAADLAAIIRAAGPLVFAHGHIHRAWAFSPESAPEALCVNAGSTGIVRADAPSGIGPLIYTFNGAEVRVERHAVAPDGSATTELLGRAAMPAPSVR